VDGASALAARLDRAAALPVRRGEHEARGPPISADRRTFASATTAAGSEIAENVLLAGAVGFELRSDLFGEAQGGADRRAHALAQIA
jgi:hypothetical protein